MTPENNAYFLEREARSERITCLIWCGVIVATYLFFILSFRDTVSPALVKNISLLVAVMLPAFASLFLLIHLGYYNPAFKYINIFLQVSLVSGAIVFDSMAQGPAYALSSMPPMAYALVPMVTAYRLRPMLAVYAGAITSLQFLLLYLLVIRPDEQMVESLPSLGLEVTMMKVIILFAMGVASAFAAHSIKRYFVDFSKAQETRNRLERSFGRFVSREIAELVKSSDDGTIPPGNANAAIVFGDIRGFTAFSAQRDSSEVTGVLNDYFQVVCAVVEAEGGIVNKFMGDGYLALFGVYSQDRTPCDAALRAVLRIRQEAAPVLDEHGLSAGAAASYGPVITGEVGSLGRCEFTAIGAPVNLASRLEGLNAQLGTSVLVSEDFLQQLSPGLYHTRSRGRHILKGIEENIEVHEVVDPSGDAQ